MEVTQIRMEFGIGRAVFYEALGQRNFVSASSLRTASPGFGKAPCLPSQLFWVCCVPLSAQTGAFLYSSVEEHSTVSQRCANL